MKKMVFQIAMTIGIIIFFLIILYQIYNLSMEGLAEEYTERQQVLTRQAASGIEGYFQHLEQITGLIASVPELREERFKEKHFEQIIYTSLETLKEQGVKNILILDRNGICKWQASGKNFLNLDLSKTEPFQISKDLKPPQFYISELSKKNILSPTPANEIIFGIPIYKLFSGINSLSSGEELSGCILLFIDSDYIFTKYITPLSQGKKGTVWVMDQKGTLIYLPEHPEMVFKNIFDKDKSCFSCHESFNPEKQMITANKFTGRNKINHSTKLLAATGFNLRQGLSGWVIATSSPFGKVAISARKSYFYILILTFSIILVLTVSSGYAIRINKKRAEALEEKVKASEEILYLKEYNENIVRNIPIGVIVIDKERKITSMNEEIVNQMRKVGVELKREEQIGKDILYQMPERLKEASSKIYDQALTEGISYEHSNITFEGKKGQFIYSVKISPLRDLKNMIVGAIITREDITQKRALEQEIKETKDYLESIFEASVDGIIVVDNKGVLTRANNAFLKMLGYSREELIGMHSRKFSTGIPEHIATNREMYALLMEKGKVSPVEIVYKKKDGSQLFVEQSAAYVKDKKENPSGSVGIIRDITEKKKLEQEIKETRDYLESIFEASVDGIIVTNNTGFLTMANNAFLKMLGYSREELIGMNTREFSTGVPEHRAAQMEMFALLMEKGKVPPVEMGWKKKDGSSLPVEQTVAALNDKKGNLSGVVAILRDITEKKKAEEKQRQLQHQLIQAEKMASIGRLAGGIAHEINNPLSGVVTNLELVKGLESIDMKKIIDECIMTNPHAECTRKMEEFYNNFQKIEVKKNRWLETAYKGGMRCKKMIKELLIFSRPSTPKEEAEVDLNECIADSIDIIGHQLEIKNIRVDKELKTDIPKLWGNRRELEQIFLNLLINSSHAIGEKGGIIKVETWMESNSVIAKVADTGCGISEENIDKIFDPFFTTKEVGEGTGLGLAIIYEIIEKHGGKIEVKSKVNAGTEFILSFPFNKSAS